MKLPQTKLERKHKLEIRLLWSWFIRGLNINSTNHHGPHSAWPFYLVHTSSWSQGLQAASVAWMTPFERSPPSVQDERFTTIECRTKMLPGPNPNFIRLFPPWEIWISTQHWVAMRESAVMRHVSARVREGWSTGKLSINHVGALIGSHERPW
jgi:hypothetical protein